MATVICQRGECNIMGNINNLETQTQEEVTTQLPENVVTK